MRGIALALALGLASCGGDDLGKLRTRQHDLTKQIAETEKLLGAKAGYHDPLTRMKAELAEVEREIAAAGEKP